jgi:hypothetical protein
VKIIKPGRPERPLTGRCDACSCVVECEESEATWLEDRPGDATACWGVKCPTPQCGRWIYLRRLPRGWPSHLRT